MTSRGKPGVNSFNNAKIAPCIVLAFAILFISGCASDNSAPDVSHLKGDFQLTRTEQLLFAIDTLATNETIQPMFATHETFWDLYFTAIMAMPTDSANPPADSTRPWRSIVSNPYLRAITDSISQDYKEMSDITSELSSAFQYLQYYFPGNRVPNVYTLNSGFGFFPFIFEDGERDGLGISLEMFLGSDFPYHDFVGNVNIFSDYLTRTYNRDHVAKKTVEVLVDDLVGPPPGDRLIDRMVHNGIKLYILDHLMPELADTVLFEFTPQQLAWCESNERNLWAHFLKDDLLYSTEFGKIQKLISPAPTVTGMPAEAPGGVANWTGWRIIHSLAGRDDKLRMVDLLSIQDAQAVLEEARYRPR